MSRRVGSEYCVLKIYSAIVDSMRTVNKMANSFADVVYAGLTRVYRPNELLLRPMSTATHGHNFKL